jgi:hypothetical protein
MTKEIDLDSTPLSTLRAERWIDLDAVTRLVGRNIPLKFKGFGTGASLLCSSRERVHPSAPDQRAFIHIQTKNKHPHSTKKHK